jgi:nucleotide-binding universal stress UspA family protein
MQTLVPVPVAVPALEAQTFASEGAYLVIEPADERESIGLRDAVERAADRLERAGLTVSGTVVDGDPRRELNAEAERWYADCVFVGARGLRALDRFLLGSVSGAVLAHAHCAVEIVRNR